MYLEYIIKESAVINEIRAKEDVVLDKFRNTYSIETILKTVTENLGQLVSQDGISETYNNIKDFSKQYTIDYLNKTAKELVSI